MRTLTLPILVFSVLLTMACSTISEKERNQFFIEKYPDYELLGSDTGEGWDGVANIHFGYKKPGDQRIYQEICTFEREDGKWRSSGCWEPK